MKVTAVNFVVICHLKTFAVTDFMTPFCGGELKKLTKKYEIKNKNLLRLCFSTKM